MLLTFFAFHQTVCLIYYLNGILCSFQALDRCEYWRLSDQKGKPPGVLGWWPSRAVTFIENHDTGSTQVGPLLSKIAR